MNMLPASRRSILIGAKDPRAEEIRFIQESGFSKSQIDDIKEHLKRLESQKSSGSINKYELFDILKAAGLPITDRLKKYVQEELEKRQNKKIDFQVVMDAAITSRKFAAEEQNESVHEAENTEYVDAFIALGGGPDTNGFVNKNHIINIIKNEFELTFDMADFLEEISSSSENLDYKTFCQLFEINGNEDDNKSATSKKSLLSVFSEKGRKSSGFNVKYKDFLKFCERTDFNR